MISVAQRVIPCVLLRDRQVVQSQGFSSWPVIGSPFNTIRRLIDFQADEVIILDISEPTGLTLSNYHRDDLALPATERSLVQVVRRIVSETECPPMAVGGGIRKVEDAVKLIEAGADKLVLNSAIWHLPSLVRELVEEFGSQCIVASIDVEETGDNSWEIFDWKTARAIERNFFDGLRYAADLGVGEILINNRSRDGYRTGQNLELIKSALLETSVPLIAVGGIGSHADFQSALRTGVSAVAASNYFHALEVPYPLVKKRYEPEFSLRPYDDAKTFRERDGLVDVERNQARFNARVGHALELESAGYEKAFSLARPENFFRCSSCVMVSSSATPLSFDSKGVCSGCQAHFSRSSVAKSSAERQDDLFNILSAGAEGRDYDCVVAVSGGKDSYFQAHFIKNVLGLRPLLVTYDGNNWTPAGWQNLVRMREAIGADHIVVRPNNEVLSRLNIASFVLMGDMNWHAHLGIMTVPMKVAIEKSIPWVIYGEHGYEDLAGQFLAGDGPEVNYRERLEHYGRSFEWTDVVGIQGLTSSDLGVWKYPTDRQLLETSLRGLHLSSFLAWAPDEQTELVKQIYGWQDSQTPFARTYRTASNLDDMHENGLHDWLKYLKFGYGRGTDHATKDIRSGKISRGLGVELAKRHDSAFPDDFERWISMTEMKEDLFFRIANSFRSPKIWRFVQGRWIHPELETLTRG